MIASPAKVDAALGRRIDAGENVHHRALARAIGADQAMDGAGRDGQVDTVEGLDAAEAHHQPGPRRGGFRPPPRSPERRRVAPAPNLVRGSGVRPAGSDLGDACLDKADDALRQIIDDVEDHRAEDGEPVVGDRVEEKRYDKQADAQTRRDRHPGEPFGMPDVVAIAARTATAAMIPAMMRNKARSARRFGRSTMIAAPRIGPSRDFRPPIVTASRNCTDSSKVKLSGAIYCSE